MLIYDINNEPIKVINRLIIGGMTAKNYISINKTSNATAARDLQQLNEMDILI